MFFEYHMCNQSCILYLFTMLCEWGGLVRRVFNMPREFDWGVVEKTLLGLGGSLGFFGVLWSRESWSCCSQLAGKPQELLLNFAFVGSRELLSKLFVKKSIR